MTPVPYLIEEVGPDWVLQSEEMGGKAKFWYRPPGENETAWLFKFPRENTGEHWAEKVAAEVAGLLDIPCARVELAAFQGVRGSATVSFISGNQQLFHGNQILARHVGDYDPDRKFGQSRHTLENIWLALEGVFEDPEGVNTAKAHFAEFLVLDAVIGNTDRHHENWGVARRRDESGGWVGYLAPSFDHASSLGRELKDKRREGLLVNSRVGNYSEKGLGGVYWSESNVNSTSPLELVRLASGEYPELIAPALSKVSRLDEKALSEIVGRVPADWITPVAMEFAQALLCYNYKQLQCIHVSSCSVYSRGS